MQRTKSQSSIAADVNVEARSSRGSIVSMAGQNLPKSQSRRGSGAGSLSPSHGPIRAVSRVSSTAASGQAAPPTGRRASTSSLANRRPSQVSIAASTSSRSSRGSQSSRPPLSKRNSNVSTSSPSSSSSSSSSSKSSFEEYVSPKNAQELRQHIARLLPILMGWRKEATELVRPTQRSSKPNTPGGSPFISAEDYNGAKTELVEAIDAHAEACRSLLADLNKNGFSQALAAEYDSLEDESWNISWIYRGLHDINSREGQYFLAAGLNML